MSPTDNLPRHNLKDVNHFVKTMRLLLGDFSESFFTEDGSQIKPITDFNEQARILIEMNKITRLQLISVTEGVEKKRKKRKNKNK